jgi:hypothetical protein
MANEFTRSFVIVIDWLSAKDKGLFDDIIRRSCEPVANAMKSIATGSTEQDSSLSLRMTK